MKLTVRFGDKEMQLEVGSLPLTLSAKGKESVVLTPSEPVALTLRGEGRVTLTVGMPFRLQVPAEGVELVAEGGADLLLEQAGPAEAPGGRDAVPTDARYLGSVPYKGAIASVFRRGDRHYIVEGGTAGSRVGKLVPGPSQKLVAKVSEALGKDHQSVEVLCGKVGASGSPVRMALLVLQAMGAAESKAVGNKRLYRLKETVERPDPKARKDLSVPIIGEKKGEQRR